eukprot:jgi/Galph1/5106/GphlegSOOS_G3777.1
MVQDESNCEWFRVSRRRRKNAKGWHQTTRKNERNKEFSASSQYSGRKGDGFVTTSPVNVSYNGNEKVSMQQVEELEREILVLVEKLGTSQWWQGLRRMLQRHQFLVVNDLSSNINSSLLFSKSVNEIVCYGLGSFERSLISKYQLALAKLLSDHCFLEKEKRSETRLSCLIYDPVMSLVDTELCKNLGFVVPTCKEDIQHCIESRTIKQNGKAEMRTLFFMPHCGRSLYNAVLEANWKPFWLRYVVIIGNSFSFYQSILQVENDNGSHSYLHYASKWVREIKLPAAKLSPLYEAFNDLSIHMFPEENIPPEHHDIWNQTLSQDFSE